MVRVVRAVRAVRAVARGARVACAAEVGTVAEEAARAGRVAARGNPQEVQAAVEAAVVEMVGADLVPVGFGESSEN